MSTPTDKIAPPPSAESSHLGRYLPALMVGVLGAALTLVGYYLLRHKERQRAEAQFGRVVEAHLRMVQRERDDIELLFLALQTLFQFSDSVNRPQFHQAVAELATERPGLEMIAWAPRITHPQRDAFETSARSDGLPGFQFTERTPAGQNVRAAARDEYFPLYFCEPATDREARLGDDLAARPELRASLAKARDSGRPVVTGALRQNQPPDRPPQILIIAPVYASGALLDTVQSRQQSLRGFILGLLDLQIAAETVFRHLPTGGLDVLLTDNSENSSNRVLAYYPAQTHLRQITAPDAAALRAGMHLGAKVHVGGREWSLLFRPTPEWLAASRSGYAGGAVLAGLSLTALLAVYLASLARRTLTIERQVALRTTELRASNQQWEHEVADRRRIETDLRNSQLQLAEAQEIAHIGSWQWEVKANTVAWSAELYRIFGLKPEEVSLNYEAFLTRILTEDRAGAQQIIARSLQDHEPFLFECRIHRPDGAVRWLQSRGKVVLDDAGEVRRMVGTAQDITDRKEGEAEHRRFEQKLQEAQKLESLGVLAGGIAHDFNNLLTGILGNAGLVRMELPPDSVTLPYIGQIETTAMRAADLCTQMLAYSGKGRFHVTRLDLSHLVTQTIPLLQVSISKKVLLKFDLSPRLPPVLGDPTQLRQIIMNLVINGSEAIGEREGCITVRTTLQYADHFFFQHTTPLTDLPAGDYVLLEVADDGCGMTPETRAKIFDPFFTTKFLGRGLGLAAVQGIVRGHQGTLKVVSAPGRGTTFTLLLPPASGPIEPVKPEPPAVTPWHASGTVMVVDDEEAVRLVASQMLRSFGFHVLAASDGREALASLQAEPQSIRLVLLDLTMPHLDGEETFFALRQVRPDLPVLLMSGYTEEELSHRFAGKGLSGFICKPFKPEALRAKVRSVLADLPLP